MDEALRRVGITAKRIERGEIYWVSDEEIRLPESELPNQLERNIHPTRPVLVLQTDEDNEDTFYPIVLVAPLTHRVEYKDNKDYQLRKGQGGVTKDSLILLGQVQPILKTKLMGTPTGKLDNITMIDVDAILSANLGLIGRPFQNS